MDKILAVNCCLGLILLHGALSVEGRSIFNSGHSDVQSKILSLLLHKSLTPVEQDDSLGVELANKLAEFEELQALRENLELERALTANLAEEKSRNQKRGEPCFWKYCV